MMGDLKKRASFELREQPEKGKAHRQQGREA